MKLTDSDAATMRVRLELKRVPQVANQKCVTMLYGRDCCFLCAVLLVNQQYCVDDCDVIIDWTVHVSGEFVLAERV